MCEDKVSTILELQLESVTLSALQGTYHLLVCEDMRVSTIIKLQLESVNFISSARYLSLISV